MTERDKMLAGQLYDPSDAELTALLIKARKLARRYNQTDEDEPEKRTAILRELLPNTPNLPGLQAPIYFDYGCNTTFGRFSGANFNFTCLDVCPVHIGDNVMIGPNVTLATPMHPLLPEERNVRHDENGRYYNLGICEAHHDRGQLLAGLQCSGVRRCYHRGRQRDLRGQRGNKGYSAPQSGRRQSLSRNPNAHGSGSDEAIDFSL